MKKNSILTFVLFLTSISAMASSSVELTVTGDSAKKLIKMGHDTEKTFQSSVSGKIVEYSVVRVNQDVICENPLRIVGDDPNRSFFADWAPQLEPMESQVCFVTISN